MDQYKTKRADDDPVFDSLSLSYHHHYHCHVIRWNMRYDIFRINDYVVTLSESSCQKVQLAITYIDPQTTKQ